MILHVVVGPTASGKSAFAEELALKFGGEIINADSQQFYHGMDIGTGKVPIYERKVRRWLLDVCQPGEWMSAGEFARQADGVITTLLAEGKAPIVEGGTGLYLRALLEGLDPLPPRDEEVRQKLREEIKAKGAEALYQRLADVDPVSAAKISPQDPQRVIRYLEIYLVSGKVPSELMKRGRPEKLRYVTDIYHLQPDREVLRERIELRVRAMIAHGWLEEVRGLMEGGVDPRELSNKPIGYGELASVVVGEALMEDAVEKIILKTRQYAKRQETFFRGLLRGEAYHRFGSCVNP